MAVCGLFMESLIAFVRSFRWNWSKVRWFDPFRGVKTKNGIVVGREGGHGEKRGRIVFGRHAGDVGGRFVVKVRGTGDGQNVVAKTRY